jgi:CheY-like chemotaxis protein
MNNTQTVILAVDDNPANLNLLFDLLDEAGFEVLVSQSGESAIKRAETTHPDIILLDVMMPGIDGFETCRRLKAHEATQDIPIIFMTAVTEIDEKVKGFDLGAVDYVTKPIQPKEVLARVTTHLTIQRLQKDLKAALEREKAQEKRKTVFVSTTSNLIGTLINTIAFSVNSLKQNNDHMTSVQSTIGKGSLFWFEMDFPEIPGFAPKNLPYKHKIKGYKGERRTVLITDDKPKNRSVLVDMLLPLGFYTFEAENGQECVDKALQHRPDVILLDIRMPVMDGFEAARRLRTLDEVRDIPIIAVSASVFEERRKQILEAGCDVYIAKPFEVEDLLHVLQTYLHLEWTYTEETGEPINMAAPGNLEPGQFVELPPEHVNNLIAFAERGSLTKILAELDTIERLNAEYAPTVQQLRRLTKGFRFDDIIISLKQKTD